MGSRVGKHIRKNMQSMETDRLLEIWIDNDRESYSNEAFKIIAEAIAEKKVELPPQKDYKQLLQDKKSIGRNQTTGWLKQFYYPVTDLDAANN